MHGEQEADGRTNHRYCCCYYCNSPGAAVAVRDVEEGWGMVAVTRPLQLLAAGAGNRKEGGKIRRAGGSGNHQGEEGEEGA